MIRLCLFLHKTFMQHSLRYFVTEMSLVGDGDTIRLCFIFDHKPQTLEHFLKLV